MIKSVLSMFSDNLFTSSNTFTFSILFLSLFEGYLDYLLQNKYWCHLQTDKKIVLRMKVEGY